MDPTEYLGHILFFRLRNPVVVLGPNEHATMMEMASAICENNDGRCRSFGRCQNQKRDSFGGQTIIVRAEPDILFLKHASIILRQSSNPAQSLSCSIMEKPHTGLDDCLNMLLSCFRKSIYASDRQPTRRATLNLFGCNI